MMPVRFIRQKLIQEAVVIDLEAVGARLKHHGFKISVDNMILSDVGDNWKCEMSDFDNELSVTRTAPSLRTAMIRTFEGVEEILSGKKGKV